MDLELFWFCVIAFFWAGYFVLEGFDFGVGMLLPALPRDEPERKALLETIGPFWDGNEVWLVIAAGATFAAFPEWYGTMFSGFYLVLLLILVLLIVRAVSFEWRDRGEGGPWRRVWLAANVAASFGVPFLWGVGLAALLGGVPLDADGHFDGGVLDLFSPYTIVAGVSAVALFAFHGATYLTLRTTGDLCARAERAARRLSVPAALLVAAFLVWTVAMAVDRNDRDVFPVVLPAVLGIGALALAVVLVLDHRSGWSFAATALAAALWVVTLFTGLYPRVMVSDPDFGNSLTVDGAASSHYSLTVMTVAAVILAPLVLLYQGWTYRVFRERVGGEVVAPGG